MAERTFSASIERVWERLTTTDFGAARVALHWAAQIPSAAAATLIAPRGDASHTALAWDESRRALVSENGVALLVERFAVTYGESTIPLAGMGLEPAIAVLAAAMGKQQLKRPPHELPPHPVGTGAPFDKPDPNALAELARWYADAHRALARFGTVRCWPQHLDIAALVAVEDGARPIGVGMSPGDASHAEPYWYVTPSAPAERAVLRGSALLAEGDQAAALDRFLDGATAAARAAVTAKS